MKTKKIGPIGVTGKVIEVVFSHFIRLLKGEQIMDFFVRTGGVTDTSLAGLVNTAFRALFSFINKVHPQPCVSSNISPKNDINNLSISLPSSKDITPFHPRNEEIRRGGINKNDSCKK